jgi:MtfA peptidase
MFFTLRKWRRKRLLAKRSIPDDIWDAVLRETPVLQQLPTAEQRHLRELALLFLHEKAIEPARGLVLTDEMRARIAALACLPIQNIDAGLDLYDSFHAVIVYPDEFLVRGREHMDEAGVLHSSDEVLVGEAWEQGPVVLSWSDVEASGRGDGFNVVAHEFAHKLDALDGSVNGIPPLHRGMDRAAWTQAFQGAYDELCQRIDSGEDTWLDPYAAESPGEFFAVCTEMYFEVPGDFRTHYPALYEQMSLYFTPRPGEP